MGKRIDTPFWLMIGVLLSQIAAGLMVDRFSELDIGGPVAIIGVIMIAALCTIKVLAYFDLPARWREERLQRVAEAEEAARDGIPVQATTDPDDDGDDR